MELSQLLGGTDRTVKQYLFGLSGGELESVLTEYGRRYGEAAQSYAEETLPRWRAGEVSMSGMVAERLYRLLPPQMPIKIKYRITEDLWRHVGPTSRKTLRFGPDVQPDEVVVQVQRHIESVVLEYRFPDTLERSFDWLSSGDVLVKQQLLNYFRSLDKSLVVEAARLQVDVMFRQSFGESAEQIQRFTHTLSVGKHLLKLVADPGASGWGFEDYSTVEPRAEPTRQRTSDGGDPVVLIAWALGLGGLAVMFATEAGFVGFLMIGFALAMGFSGRSRR